MTNRLAYYRTAKSIEPPAPYIGGNVLQSFQHFLLKDKSFLSNILPRRSLIEKWGLLGVPLSRHKIEQLLRLLLKGTVFGSGYY
jgi:hypothetical protein